MNYYNAKIIENTTIGAIRPKVEEELKKEGFGVLTEIDLQAVMKKKTGQGLLAACYSRSLQSYLCG